MAQIIQFTAAGSNTYQNLERLIRIAESAEVLEFYAKALAVSYEEGRLFSGEEQALSGQIRNRLQEVGRPDQKPAQDADAPGVYIYCPEMGEQKPDCQIEAQLSYYGKHYYLYTPLELRGKGIVMKGVLEENNLTASGKYRTGWLEYKVTERAFNRLKEKYSISMESWLD